MKMESLEAGTTSESEYEYQVFLNFRGPDTRNEFTDFLYHSLIDAGIHVFRDDEELRVGERIDEALQRVIDNARIYIPIFSPTYASSKWCLCELTQIMGNTKSNKNKEILPIFFKVEPKDVKMEDGLYHNAILNLKRENKASTEQVDSWRKALTEVAAIKGREVKTGDSQAKLTKLVVEEVVVKLKIKQKSVTEPLIGINDRVIEVRNLLDKDSGGVRLIQIYGMGGVGKTTLAKVVFNELFTHFGKCCCFLENIRENSSRTDDLVKLQKNLLSEIGNVTGTGSIDDLMKMIEGRLHNKKVLIVLDDVDNNKQVEKLVGKGALCSGSRILITTRNKDVLQSTGSQYKMFPYEMKAMSSGHALELFSRHVFEKDSPSNDHYKISKEIVYATGSLPLTIEVIGSLLKNKTLDIWKEKLDELQKAPPGDVFEKLKISYDALNFEQQQIFLDIACFFIGAEQTNAIYMWKDCELFPISGIAILENMSLIKIGEDNKFLMHDQLRDLGREIVRRENLRNPEERSRLWNQEEVLNAIRIEKMENNVRAMEFHGDVPIRSETIRKFKNLRFLTLWLGTFVGDLMDCFPELRWICWRCPSYESIELTNMRLNKVVIIEFSAINFIDNRKFWSLIKEARRLKVLRLDNCHGITRIPDLSRCSTLERLTFFNCGDLRKIDSSIGELQHMIELKFDHCHMLEDLPKEIGDLQKLEYFSLKKCHKIQELPDFIFKWKSLRELHFSTLGPVELPDAIRELENLEVLRVKGNLKGQLPSEIGLLSKLKKLVLKWCDEIQESPTLPVSLTHLAISSMSLQIVPDLSNLTNLVELDLRDGSYIMDGQDKIHTSDLKWIERLSKLKELTLCLFHVPAPTELSSLPQLNRLHLSGLNLQRHTRCPSSLSTLILENFNSVVLLFSNLKNLSCLVLIRSQMQEIQLDGLQLPNLTDLYVNRCEPLEKFKLSSMRKLEEVTVSECPKLDEIHIDGVLESLQKLYIGKCKSFRRFVYINIPWDSSHESSLMLESRVFNKLWHLWLEDCDKILGIQVFGMSELLEELVLSGHHLQSLGGLSNLTNLKSLRICYAYELRIIEGLDKLKFLKELQLSECGSLESLIDVSTTQLPNDCQIQIIHCPKLCGVKQGFYGSVLRFKHYKEEESVLAALTDPLMVRHPSMVLRAKSSLQVQMCVLGTMGELLSPFERSPGFLLLEDQREEEEDRDAGERAGAPKAGPAMAAGAAAAGPAELVGELEQQQQQLQQLVLQHQQQWQQQLVLQQQQRQQQEVLQQQQQRQQLWQRHQVVPQQQQRKWRQQLVLQQQEVLQPLQRQQLQQRRQLQRLQRQQQQQQQQQLQQQIQWLQLQPLIQRQWQLQQRHIQQQWQLRRQMQWQLEWPLRLLGRQKLVLQNSAGSLSFSSNFSLSSEE